MAKGIPISNETSYLVNEYSMRKRLAGMGYTFDIAKLTPFKAECFYIIETEIEKTLSKESKKSGSRNR